MHKWCQMGCSISCVHSGYFDFIYLSCAGSGCIHSHYDDDRFLHSLNHVNDWLYVISDPANRFGMSYLEWAILNWSSISLMRKEMNLLVLHCMMQQRKPTLYKIHRFSRCCTNCCTDSYKQIQIKHVHIVECGRISLQLQMESFWCAFNTAYSCYQQKHWK